ncbi:MAG: Holliday junction branch migration DNA helicase RuvB [bacterium]|nr:Holliday junction branch migration DNA helicase RuvB [bacterium]
MHTNDAPERVITEDAPVEERVFEFSLRPRTMAEFVGQARLKENLSIFMEAAKKRGEPIEHVLLCGTPGLGKTTLAHIIAQEMGSTIKVTSGPALERIGDLAAILTNLETGDVLFIDEIHRMNRSIEEVLYPAMEDHALDLVVGKGPTARTLRLSLNRFTIIGATTRMSLLSAPLRDRFGAVHHLNFYTEPDLVQIIMRSAKLLGVSITSEAAGLVAARSRRTPRVANRLLKRIRDFAEVRADGRVDQKTAEASLEHLEIDAVGLDETDRRILSTIIEKFNGGPVGLSALAAATAEEIATLEEVYEPYLLQLGLINRTPRGRVATPHAYQHLGLPVPQQTLV